MNRPIGRVAALGIASFSFVLLALGAAPAPAQTTTPRPLPPKTHETGPTLPPPGGAGRMGPGVIRPPSSVDPQMPRSTPDAGRFPTPIVPPPAVGGERRVQPK